MSRTQVAQTLKNLGGDGEIIEMSVCDNRSFSSVCGWKQFSDHKALYGAKGETCLDTSDGGVYL